MCFKSFNKKIKKLVWYDISLIKLSTAAFILMLVTWWPGLASLNWYWYLIIGLLAAISPTKKMFCKK